MRDRYILPVGLAWVAIGAGLFIGLKSTWKTSNNTSEDIAASRGDILNVNVDY